MAIDRFEFTSLRSHTTSMSRHHLKFILPILLILGTSIYLFSSHSAVAVPEYTHLYNIAASGRKELFVEDFLRNEIDGPYDTGPLKKLCAAKERRYQAGLVVKCQSPIGGFGNIKNMALNCLRFGLEAGASSFVLPEITVRAPNDLTDLASGVTEPFDYLFDLQHFIRSFASACPQVKLYLKESELLDAHPNITGIDPLIKIGPWELPDTVHHPMAESIITNVDTWRKKFDNWLRDTQPPFSAEKPVAVTIIGAPLLRWPINYDPPAFIATYGRLIKIRHDVRKTAAAVLFSLSELDNLAMDPARPGVQKGKFYGVHLRTDVDAAKVQWPGYETQSKNYLLGGSKSGLKSMYVASGSPEDSARFMASALELGIVGHMKDSLLARPGFEVENEKMKSMTWDQQGLVDYEVMLHSSYFSGVFESSFSWAISNRRHVVLGGGTWKMIYEGHTGAEAPGPECFIDEFSTIYGPKDMIRLRWQFPLALWP